MKSNKRNFCGGNFQDWLEVMLTDRCNGKCSWCIERKGYHPKDHATWQVLSEQILSSGKTHIVLLGGEPTLYPDLKPLVNSIASEGKKVYMTTNGGMLTPAYANEYLKKLFGINISIHDYDLGRNEDITGICLERSMLTSTIQALHGIGGAISANVITRNDVAVRLNCNLIKGHVDSKKEIEKYIRFGLGIGADSIRFAELKDDQDNFVSLHDLYAGQYGINNEPFGLGCNTDAKINGMPINFRQMCGLQTDCRESPVDPEQLGKRVLYYNGEFYNGWQTRKEEVEEVTDKQLVDLLQSVANGNTAVAEAALRIAPNTVNTPSAIPSVTPPVTSMNDLVVALVGPPYANPSDGGGCQY